MFQNLASYLLGSVVNQSPEGNAEEEEVVDENNIRIRTSDEDDWVLVDRDSEGGSLRPLRCLLPGWPHPLRSRVGTDLGNSDACSVSSVEDEQADTFHRVSLTRSNSESSLVFPYGSMDESWFVTPPACFTSTGPVGLRTSPLENLLIEHPSMSVYYFHPSMRNWSPVLWAAQESVEAAKRKKEEDARAAAEAANKARQELVVKARLPRFPCTDILHEVQHHIMSKRAQKMQIQKTCKQVTRSNLERINKAREVNSRNQRQRRGQRSQGANCSHANNNRKC